MNLPPFSRDCPVMSTHVRDIADSLEHTPTRLVNRAQVTEVEASLAEFFALHVLRCRGCADAATVANLREALPYSSACHRTDHCVLQVGHDGECSATFGGGES